MQSLFDTLMLILQILWFVMIVQIIMSWLINFQVLNLRQPLVAQIWGGLNAMLEPLYSRIRRLIPIGGGIDLAPLIVIIVIFFLQRFLVTSLY